MELPEWSWEKRKDKTIFFGLYHWKDYLRFILHKGERKVFWCGSDIISLKDSVWQAIIPYVKATHYCENEVEQMLLFSMGIQARVLPMIFDDPKLEVRTPSKDIQVYITAHPGRDFEYGIHLIPPLAHRFPEITFHVYGIVNECFEDNVIWHGQVSEDQFNEEIKSYHAALRLNVFDGFAETLAKSVLLGQHPISVIPYPYIEYARPIRGLINALKSLKDKQSPNIEAREYWLNTFENNLQTLKL